ncbi:hypothetical protein EEL31_10450 [Brevibacillus laterosporus]|nr:hypothetical protein [Brevibacillus laterosporus]TPG68909.1 hypothetical protein EEL31_10450 [Brevibacillus laterosporus]
MATRQMQVLTQRGNHEVGNLNSIKIRTLAHGAKVIGEIDNFTLVELGFNAEGERTCKQLSDVENKSYLIATPEARYLGEELIDFYNAENEYARIVHLDEGVRFDTSAYKLNTGVTEVKEGQVAHFDPATKKFVLSGFSTPHADYTKAKAKFLVVNNEENLDYTCGKALVRLEVIES